MKTTALSAGQRPVPPAAPPVKTPVLVVGAGPVGAVLALELARRNIPCLLVERTTEPSQHPKMDYVNSRSMELLRRIGLSGEIRTRGIDASFPADFLWTRGFQEPPVAVWHHPSVTDLAATYAGRNDGSAPVEPYQRVQGSLLEEILRRAAREHPLIDLREGWAFVDLLQESTGIVASLVDSGTRTRHTVRARFLAACDGAKSTVRQHLGIPLDDAGPRTSHCSVYFRSGDPLLRRYGRAFVTIAARGLTLVSRDEADTWTASMSLPDSEPLTADPVALMNERLGVPFHVDEVLNVAQWEGSLAIAGAYRCGSAFLVGDAAHHFFPTGGYGANTGIADAADLAWKLAARLKGWGGAALLDSYEQERRPVAMFNREMCANLLEVWRRFGRLTAGGASRECLAGFLAEETYQLDNDGIHLGYRYDTSPVVWHGSDASPVWRWRRATPTTWPGSRAPALCLPDGSPLFDRLGADFTLVDFTGSKTGEQLAAHANQRGVPVTHLPIDDELARRIWERALVLVRPDHHVAWRGDNPPEDWDAVLDRVCGISEEPASGIPWTRERRRLAANRV
jgi:2-polyprenyl-6-methoxyphenol hydroxylase-like FAD-dependent oxidoreductase